MYIRYVRNHFHGQKTFCLVGGSLSWSETPYFHKVRPDLKFVKNFTRPDFQAINVTH